MIRLLMFLLLSLFLSSCSNQPSELIVIESKTTTPEATRETLFTYGETTQNSKIRLTFSSEPVPIKEGYVKLVGIIAGKTPLACLEIGGKGEVFGVGDRLDQYIVASIKKKEVVLCLKK